MSEHDPILAAIQATEYADAIMRRTAAGPDESHTDWQPKYRDSSIEKWHPPYGETHVKYHVYQVGGGNNPVFWRANHHGTYQGVKTVRSPLRGDDPEFDVPVYSTGDEPERVMNWNRRGNSHPLNFRSVDDAKAAAEEHYKENYGTPPSHDYDIDSIMGEHGVPPAGGKRGLGDDEDYSRIFDAVRRALKRAGALLRRTATDYHLTDDGGSSDMFDWKPEFTRGISWSSPTETGHTVRVSDPYYVKGSGREIADRDENGESDMGWSWQIHDMNHPQLREQFEEHGHHRPADRSSVNAELMGGKVHAPDHGTDPKVYSGEYLPTREHAEKQLQQAYMELARKSGGQPRQRPDYDIDKIMGETGSQPPQRPGRGIGDDEDYGHIFGMHARYAAAVSGVSDAVAQRIAAELSAPCPDCGQVAGWDEHMVSPRIKVCRNCEYPMTDDGHDDLLESILRGHDREVGDLPETDHPNLGKHGNAH